MTLVQISLPIAAAILSFALTPLVARLAVRVGAVDMPGVRKIHTVPIPRLGGLAILVAVASVLGVGTWCVHGVIPPGVAAGIGLGVLPVIAVSLVDDIRGVRAGRKFLVHLVGALIAVSMGVSLRPVVHLYGTAIQIGWLAAPLSLLWLVGVTNAFNIIDGLDGLSAGLALISASTMAAVFALMNQQGLAVLSLVVAGAIAGFLPYNTHPARLFLGDTGATAIGFGLAALALKSGTTMSSGFAVLLPMVLCGLPIADTLIAMARRAIGRIDRGVGGMFVPDRNHIHHRLLALGITHRRAVLSLYGTGMAIAGAGFVSLFLDARAEALFLLSLLIVGLIGMQRLGYDEFAFLRRGTVLRLYDLPVVKRKIFAVLIDALLVMLSGYVAIGLKNDVWAADAMRPTLIGLMAIFAPLTILIFRKSGMYRGSWRLAGLHDITKTCTTFVKVFVPGALIAGLWSASTYPMSLLAVYGIVHLFLVLGVRFSYVLLLSTQCRASVQGTPMLIWGSGRRGVEAAWELLATPDAGFRPIGFIDDDPRTHRRYVRGLRVFGSMSQLPAILRTHPAGALLVAIDRVSPHRLSAAAEHCREGGLSLFRMNVRLEPVADSGPGSLTAATSSASNLGGVEFIRTPAGTACAAGAAGAHAGARQVTGSANLESADISRGRCPGCGGRDIHRSNVRTMYERAKKAYSMRRPFRCHGCGWRGWMMPSQPFEAITLVPGKPDLAGLDRMVSTFPKAPARRARTSRQ